MFKKFFGIGKKPYNVYSGAYVNHISSGWEILKRVFNILLNWLPLVSAALMVMKLSGYFSGTWFVVIAPILVSAAASFLEDLIDHYILKANWKLQEEEKQAEELRYRRMVKEDKSMQWDDEF